MALDILAYQIAAFLGVVVGIVAATLAPYFKKATEVNATTGNTLKFDRKFWITAGIAVITGLFAGVMNFDQTVSHINFNDTVLKVFIASLVTTVGTNLGLNQFMKPSTTLLQVVSKLQAENQVLKEKLSLK